MNWEIIFSIAILTFALVSFILEKIPTDLTALIALSAVIMASTLFPEARLPGFGDIVRIFSSQAPLTIAAMFIISAALNKCGIIDQLSLFIHRFRNLGYAPVIVILVFSVGFVSAFINNTPVVVVLLPVMLSLARSMSIRASKLLIPLSYASIFGGTCTLIGTSTNILASDLVVAGGYPAIGMFEISAIGFPLLLCGTIYLVLFGKRLLPDRETLTSILSDQERLEFITEVYIKNDSTLVGTMLGDSKWLRSHGVRPLEIIRYGVALGPNILEIPLQPGDRLVLSARPSGIMKAQSIEGLSIGTESGLETISAHEGAIVEAVLAPNSSLIGRSVEQVNFRQRYRMVVMAIHRHGRNVRDRINTLPLELGDTLLLMGTDQAIENLHAGEDLILLDRPPVPAGKARRKAPIVISVLLGIILAASFDIMPIAGATIIGVALIFATGSLKPKEGYASVEWSLLVLIYGMLGVGTLMDVTGTTAWLVEMLVSGVQWSVPEIYRPIVTLAIVYATTSIFTEVLSNNATVVIMVPLVISLATSMGVDSRPFIIAVCIASSASFSTPIGYQTNTYVYSVGGYRFTDFLKIGTPLNILYFLVAVLLIPHIWPF